MSEDRLASRSVPYIAGQSPTDQPGDVWAQEAAEQGGVGTHQILSAGSGPAPLDVAAMLGVQPGDTVIGRRRLVLFNNQPVEIADAYWPADIAADTPLAETAKVPGGTAKWLADHGHITERVHEEITARLPVSEEQEHLSIGHDQPVLILRRTSYDSTGRPFEAAVMTLRADRHTLAYDIGDAA